ncbi:MAG: hypothetical protein DRP08_03185, partial [Candidatus Aenigmatarchaeota archaeon]
NNIGIISAKIIKDSKNKAILINGDKAEVILCLVRNFIIKIVQKVISNILGAEMLTKFVFMEYPSKGRENANRKKHIWGYLHE